MSINNRAGERWKRRPYNIPRDKRAFGITPRDDKTMSWRGEAIDRLIKLKYAVQDLDSIIELKQKVLEFYKSLPATAARQSTRYCPSCGSGKQDEIHKNIWADPSVELRLGNFFRRLITLEEEVFKLNELVNRGKYKTTS